MPNIYRKTAKGVTEIGTRAHKLAPRFRLALILVDGKRDAAELGKLILQQPSETLAELTAQGFIELLATPAPAPASAAQPSGQAVQAPPPKPVSPTAAFESRRRQAVRLMIDLTGPMSEALAVRMERAQSATELEPLLQSAKKVIANTRGQQAAEDYIRRLGAL